jgi:hypothetical protein
MVNVLNTLASALQNTPVSFNCGVHNPIVIDQIAKAILCLLGLA